MKKFDKSKMPVSTLTYLGNQALKIISIKAKVTSLSSFSIKARPWGFVVNQFKKEFTDNIEISLGMGSPFHFLL